MIRSFEILAVSVLLVGFSFVPGELFGQVPNQRPLVLAPQAAARLQLDEGMIEQLRQQFLDRIDVEETMARERLELRIAEISQECNLEKEQTAKLQLTSKVVVKSYSKKIREQYQEICRIRGFELDPDAAAPEADKEEDSAPASRVRLATLATRAITNNGPSQIEEEERWKSALDKILTDEQTSQWAARIEERAMFHRDATLRVFIAALDRQLLLSADQRKSLMDAMGNEYGEKLQRYAEVYGGVESLFNRRMQFAEAQRNTPEEESKTEFAKEILNEAQFEIWQKKVIPQLNIVSNLSNRAVAAAAVRVVPPVRIQVAPRAPVDVERDQENDDDDEKQTDQKKDENKR